MAKNTDIRISIGFFSHNKTIKLKRKLGPEAALALIQLWVYTAENKPEGILTGMDEEDIAIAAGWDGDAADLVTTLVSTKFLDKCEHYAVHDWEEHNPWAAGAKQRSDKAKMAARARWGAQEKHISSINGECSPDASSNATGMLEQCPEHNLAMPDSESSNAPSPSPSPYQPSPKPKDIKSTPPAAGPSLRIEDQENNEALLRIKEQAYAIKDKFDLQSDKWAYLFIQKTSKNNSTEYPAEAYIRVFDDLLEAKNPVDDLWAFSTDRLKLHRQNVREERHMGEHEKQKSGDLVDISDLLGKAGG
ncbi:MAG: hypothetical protein P1S46_06205 [bacterium]|nr:hypothetical protein [bacterium]